MPEQNRKLIAGFNLPMVAMSIAVAVFMLWGSYPANGYLVDGQGYLLGRDFVNFWHYGLAAWGEDPARFYDPHFNNAVLDRLIPGYDYPNQDWSYPPHYMLIAAPFGLVGYNLALALYTALGLFLYWRFVVSEFTGKAERIALFVTPTVTVFLLCGQASAFVAVIFVAIYRLLDKRPVIAGLLIALLTVKPQIGLLIPFFLIFTGRWKVFFAAAAGTVAFIGLSILVYGWEIWWTYLAEDVAVQARTMTHSPAVVQGMMPTVYVDFIMMGAGQQLAMAAQAIVALGAITFIWRVIRTTDDRFLQFSGFLAASFVVTPYLMAYDSLVLGWMMLGLMARAPMNAWQGIVYRLVMILCPLGVTMALNSVPGTPLVLVGLAVWVWQAARAEAGICAPAILNRATAP